MTRALRFVGRSGAVRWPRLVAVSGLVALMSVAGARPAQACKCGPPADIAFVTSPYVDQSHGLKLRAHSATLRCEGRRRAPRCRYEARYTIDNPTDASVEAAALVLGSRDTHPQVQVDGGAPRSRGPAPLDDRAIEHALAAGEDQSSQGRVLTREAFVLVVAAREAVTVTVQTPVTPTLDPCDCGGLQIERRHMVVSRDMELSYLVEHVIGFGLGGELPPLHSEVVTPLRWPAWWRFGDRGIEHGKWVERRSEALGDDYERWRFDTRPPVLWGGPFAAVGVGWRKDPGLALRAGWEVARPGWLVTSLAVETDAQSHVELVPALEGIFPVWPSVLVFFPNPGLGVGVPVELVPQRRAGIRTQLTLSWHVFSILGAVDVYPSQRGIPGKLYGALLFQAGI